MGRRIAYGEQAFRRAMLAIAIMIVGTAATMTTATVAEARSFAVVRAVACFTTTHTVPVYETINGRIVHWAGKGQGINVTLRNGPWRFGSLWGTGHGWIHSHYLRKADGSPCL
ncbi:hypothetical protein [Spongiactinospora rosea]|nr:hypothetical protein [Spongiactinospora rosea]